MTSGDGTTVAAPAPASRASGRDEWDERRWRVASLLLVLLLLAFGGTALAFGERESSYGDLVGAVVDGDVQHVELHGALDDGALEDDDWSRSRLVLLRWTETVDHYAEVRVDEDPRDVLRALQPDLVVDALPPTHGSRFTIAGWSGPMVLWWMGLAAVIAVLVLIVSGPQPWRATRWAWFWLFALASPVGLVAYVVLAGPVVGLRPSDPRRRLTGGWAFLLAFFVVSAFLGGSRT